MRNNMTRRMVLGALFTALICVVTHFTAFLIPGSGNGYINAGDAMIYASAVAMGNPWAVIAAGIGSALSDIITAGGIIYAPGTLVIKALMGLIVGLAYSRKRSWPLYLGLMSAASLVMAAGYTAYQFLLFLLSTHGVLAIEGGVDSPFILTAVIWESPVIWNLLQAVLGVALGLPLAMQVRRIMPKSLLDAFRKPESKG
jgi:uncharacterized membrane protein